MFCLKIKVCPHLIYERILAIAFASILSVFTFFFTSEFDIVVGAITRSHNQPFVIRGKDQDRYLLDMASYPQTNRISSLCFFFIDYRYFITAFVVSLIVISFESSFLWKSQSSKVNRSPCEHQFQCTKSFRFVL